MIPELDGSVLEQVSALGFKILFFGVDGLFPRLFENNTKGTRKNPTKNKVNGLALIFFMVHKDLSYSYLGMNLEKINHFCRINYKKSKKTCQNPKLIPIYRYRKDMYSNRMESKPKQ